MYTKCMAMPKKYCISYNFFKNKLQQKKYQKNIVIAFIDLITSSIGAKKKQSLTQKIIILKYIKIYFNRKSIFLFFIYLF